MFFGNTSESILLSRPYAKTLSYNCLVPSKIKRYAFQDYKLKIPGKMKPIFFNYRESQKPVAVINYNTYVSFNRLDSTYTK